MAAIACHRNGSERGRSTNGHGRNESRRCRAARQPSKVYARWRRARLAVLQPLPLMAGMAACMLGLREAVGRQQRPGGWRGPCAYRRGCLAWWMGVEKHTANPVGGMAGD